MTTRRPFLQATPPARDYSRLELVGFVAAGVALACLGWALLALALVTL